MLPVLLFMGWRTWLASHGVPILLGDSLFFVPVALQHLLYGDFSNPFLSPINSSGGGPLTWHGWLYPYLLSIIGRLFSVRTIPCIQVIESAIQVLSAALFALKLARLPGSVWVKLAAMVCVVSLIQGTSGRPEVVAQLLLITWLVIYPRGTVASSDYASAVVLGCIALAQPTVAALAGTLYCTCIAFKFETRPALLSILRVGVVSIALTVAATLVFYPWDVALLVRGFLEQGRLLSTRIDGDFLGTYVLSLGNPALIAWPAMLTLVGVKLWQREALKPQSVLFYPLLLISICLIWAFGIRVSFTAYNCVVFFPLVIYRLVAAISDQRIHPFNRPLAIVVLALGALTFAAQLRALGVLQLSYLKGVSINVAAESIRADVQAGRKVAMTSNMAMADYSLVKRPNVLVMTEERGDTPGDADVLYVHQAASGKREPSPRPGFVVETNRFMDGVLLAGKRLANTPAAYNYARYVREPATDVKR